MKKSLSHFIEKGLFLIDKKEISVNFIRDLEKDIALLNSIKKNGLEKVIQMILKLKDFKVIIKKKLKEMPSRKIVVFTEFGDTAYLSL